MLLGAPNAAHLPEFPEVTAIRHTGIRDRQLSDVLDDAIDHLAIDWGDRASGRSAHVQSSA